tara:strand:- start:406 stop:843 length:438 start_codon:yes stop_codon:yes gene_type:complete
MERQPHPEDSAYRDKSTKKKLDKKKTKTPGQRLEDSGQYLKDPETEDLSKGSLMIKRDTTTQQGINRDVKENQTGDQILDPEGNFKKGVYKRPTLEQLKRRAALGISTAGQVVRSANPTATVLPIATGALSLMIKGLQGNILRGY